VVRKILPKMKSFLNLHSRTVGCGDFHATGAANFSMPPGRADTSRLELAGTFGISENRFYP
jgi:hypothetical protein